MAEDKPEAADEGFTFVDKRRTNAEETAQDETAASADQAAEVNRAKEGTQSAPTEEPGDDFEAEKLGTYGLVNYVIGLLAFDAWQKLGLIADPSTGKAEKDLAQARVGIDCVAALISVVDNSESDLPESLRGELRRVLSDLRINFVEQSRSKAVP